MKTILLSFSLFLGISLSFGQTSPEKQKLTPEEHAARRTEHMSQKLALDEAQKAKLAAIFQQSAKNIEEIKANQNLKGEDKKASIQQEQLNCSNQIKAILSAEQLKKFEEMEAKRMQHREERKEQHKLEKTKM